MTDESPPKKRGRPPLEAGTPTYPVCVRLSSKQFDETYRRAVRDRITMAEAIRQAVEFRNQK